MCVWPWAARFVFARSVSGASAARSDRQSTYLTLPCLFRFHFTWAPGKGGVEHSYLTLKFSTFVESSFALEVADARRRVFAV